MFVEGSKLLGMKPLADLTHKPQSQFIYLIALFKIVARESNGCLLDGAHKPLPLLVVDFCTIGFLNSHIGRLVATVGRYLVRSIYMLLF